MASVWHSVISPANTIGIAIIKKIDCLTTTNLVNLKSNTMKNTLQM